MLTSCLNCGGSLLPTLLKSSATSTFSLALLAIGVAALTGCHNRAYNDLYVESMAAEIRDLEDQLYEYDHEYRVLEQELASLRAENQLQVAPTKNSPSKAVEPLPYYDFQPRAANPIVPSPAPMQEDVAKPPVEISPSKTQSILDSEGRPRSSAPTESTVEPLPRSPFGGTGGAAEDTLPPPNTPTGGDSTDEFDLDSLLPPTIEPGEPLPPSEFPMGERASKTPKPLENNLEMNLSRIEVPTQLANRPIGGQGKLTIASEAVTDTRVVELAFHPAHSRSVNFDDDAGDDGLVLLLLPKNERGQMVPTSAALSIVVLDPAKEGAQARIGRWDYSAAEVSQKMQPIGSNQGIQLTLPWNGPDPSADRVIVFVRYTFENGRQVIGQKEIYVTNSDGFKTVWAPRGNRTAAESNLTDPTEPVATVANTSDGQSNMVRPASGTATLDPAPIPVIR